jgi:hypothetical protein
VNLQVLGHALGSFQDNYDRLPPVDGSELPKSPRTSHLDKMAGLSWRAYLVGSTSSDRNQAKDIAVLQRWVDGKLPPPKPGEKWNQPELAQIRLDPFSCDVPNKTKEPWHTFYRVFIGDGAAFEKGKPTKLTPAEFPDGLSNTILIVEAGEAVPWPKPEELAYDPGKPLPKLGGTFPDGCYAVFADQQVRFIRRDTDEKTLRAWITRNGGEKVEPPPVVDVEALRKAAGRK